MIPAQQALLKSVMGKVAIANGKLTYQSYQKIFSGPRWEASPQKGAQTQRVLWASTSTKNPNYRDVIYVEELIGPDTVNTMPPATFDAFRDHGKLRNSLIEDIAGRTKHHGRPRKLGISMKEVTDKLTERRREALRRRLRQAAGGGREEYSRTAIASNVSRQTYTCPNLLRLR